MLNVDGWMDGGTYERMNVRTDGNLHAYVFLLKQVRQKYQEIQHFLGSDNPRMLFFLFINVKMPTIVGILTFMSRTNFMLS